jgi:hypothetical protein
MLYDSHPVLTSQKGKNVDTPPRSRKQKNRRGAALDGSLDVRLEERDVPRILKPSDAIIMIWATCV